MDRGLDTHQLEDALDTLLESSRVRSWNVIPADGLNQIKFDKFPLAYIMNVQKADQIGLHWISYFFETRNRYDFFDSFGLNPNKYIDIQQPPGRLVFENHRTLQRSTTSNCGEFSLWFINCRAQGMNMAEIEKTFVSLKVNYRYNDRMVRKFYTKIEVVEKARDSLRQTCFSRISRI